MPKPVLFVFLWRHWYYGKVLLLLLFFLVHLPCLDQVLTTVTPPSGCQTVSELYKHWTEVPHRSSVSVFNAVCCSLTYWPLSWPFKVKGHLPRYTVATVVMSNRDSEFIPRWDVTCRNHTSATLTVDLTFQLQQISAAEFLIYNYYLTALYLKLQILAYSADVCVAVLKLSHKSQAYGNAIRCRIS